MTNGKGVEATRDKERKDGNFHGASFRQRSKSVEQPNIVFDREEKRKKVRQESRAESLRHHR